MLRRCALAATLLLAACGTDTAEPGSPADAGSDGASDASASDDAAAHHGPSTYHGSVRALLEAHCVSCHTDGGIGPIALDDPDVVLSLGPAIVDAVSTRRMPPWMPSENGLEILGSRRLDTATVQAFEAWSDAAFAEGDPADYVAPEIPPSPLGTPDLVLDAGVAYTPDPTLPDDYRCLPLPMEFEEETFVTAFDVLPDQADIVHHVLVYIVAPGDVGRLAQLDESEPGPGYTCFGDARVGEEQILAGWVPGAVAQPFPERMAIRVPAGSRLVMQMHYNTTAASGPIAADRTEVALWTTDEQPDEVIVLLPFLDFRLNITAGDPEVVEGASSAIPHRGRLIGAVPHMHTLGSSIRASITTDEVGELQVIEIPEWDFNWQQFYWFHPDDYVAMNAGDRFTIECVYDNSAANQPVVNGEQSEPRRVTWGDGTSDEMCLVYGMFALPHHPSNGGTCGGFERCFAECGAGDGTCFTTCALAGGLDCLECTFDNIEDCVVSHCLDEALPYVDCAERCTEEYGCNGTTCQREFDALVACVQPRLLAGECDESLAACDVAFGE